MPALMILAHAPLASALREVAAHVFPDVPVAVLDVQPDSSGESVEDAARTLLSELHGEPTLILTDVFGATPCNVAQHLADGQNVRVVTGVNVAMLWRALAYRHEALDDLVARATLGGSQGILQVSPQAPQRQSSRSFGHDQDDPHHQQ